MFDPSQGHKGSSCKQTQARSRHSRACAHVAGYHFVSALLLAIWQRLEQGARDDVLDTDQARIRLQGGQPASYATCSQARAEEYILT